ncbi:MAG: hypothetical protein ACRDNK_02405 [Solirubrobacteraceae bacterium]
MTEPEDAIEVARAALAAQRAAGVYGEGGGGPTEATRTGPTPPTSAGTRRKLLEWAFVEPEARVLRSTRRYGAPITAVKRLLLRALAQYHGDLVANQTRFNLTLLAHLDRLEERIETLERDDGRPPA